MRRHTSATRASGFTLIEVMVVVVILAILSALAIPRLTGNSRREFELTADRVADLLLMFSQRDSLGSKPIGIRLDERRRWLTLEQLDIEANDAAAVWVIDPFVPPVKFPDVIDIASVTVYADGAPVDVRDVPLHHTPGEDRPSIQISLRSIDQVHEARIDLSPHAVAPRRLDPRRRVANRASIDLDAQGASREDW